MPWYKSHTERLMNQVNKVPSGCWEWKGAVHHRGYGQVGWNENGKAHWSYAHRLSYQTFVGPITDGLFVCHHCDNKRCINPEHLFLGTPKENTQDASRKGLMKGRPRPAGVR